MNRLFTLIMFLSVLLAAQGDQLKVFISVDMEETDGIGTGKFVPANWDYVQIHSMVI